MQRLTPELLGVGALIVYIAFFTHPPPRFVSNILNNPVGQTLVLVGIVVAFLKMQLLGFFLGLAYLASSYPTLEYMDNKTEEPKKAPEVDMTKLAALMGKPGKSEKIPQQKGKDVTTPPPETNKVKAHSPDMNNLTEKFSTF